MSVITEFRVVYLPVPYRKSKDHIMFRLVVYRGKIQSLTAKEEHRLRLP